MNKNPANDSFINSGRAKYNRERVQGTERYFDNFGEYGRQKSIPEALGELVSLHRKNKARQEAMRPLYNRKKVKQSKPFPFGFVFAAIAVSAALMFIVYNMSVINEISYETVALQEQIEYYELENQRLSVELEQKNDLAYIEKVASTELGMVKSTDVSKHYVSLTGNDKTVVTQSENEQFGLASTLDSLNRIVGKMFE